MTEGADIFFSYPGGSPSDSEQVRQLGQSLGRYGLTSWIADRDRPPMSGGVEVNPILEALDAASAVVACFGGRPGGRWRDQELARALKRAETEPHFVLLGVIFPNGRMESIPPELRRRMELFDFSSGSINAARLVPPLWERIRPRQADLLDEVVSACRQGPIALVGPWGSGKSALATVAAVQLSRHFPDGRAQLVYESNRSTTSTTRLILRTLGVDAEGMSRSRVGAAYRKLLASGRHLVVLDDVDLDRIADLIPPSPSSAIFISARSPVHEVDLPIFALPFGSLGNRAELETNTSDTQPGYASDLPDGPDLLSIQTPVNALSSVIAANAVRPPLSIGLFGDWGAGKSFFLAKMRSRIEALAAASAGVEGESAYVASVKQIVFNAWHYSDANLWASLASHVFGGLTDDDDATEGLIGRLESSRLQLEKATTQQEAAGDRRSRAESDRRAAREQVSKTKVELTDVARSASEILTENGRTEDATLLGLAGSLKEFWKLSKGLTAGIAGVVAICLGIDYFVPDIYASVVAAVVAVGGVGRVLLGPLRTVLEARARAEETADDLRRHREAELVAKVDASKRDERDAIERRDEAQRSVEDAELEIAEIKDGRRLYSFIEERAGDEAYSKYLGLVSLVRKDFEQLGRLIDHHVGVGVGDESRPRLERIVLYVDDLDRCPAARVVEVLEAVHLLLASELFVVVVAVDPRWLISSLEQHYAGEMPGSRSARGSAMPQDYLEKIFQIPYSLPPMSAEGFRRLVNSLISAESLGDGRSPMPTTTDALLGPDRSPAVEPGEPGVGFDPDEVIVGEARIDLRPKGLTVTQEELDYLRRLDLTVTTPRAVKRLTNLYRLVRVSLSADQLDLLLGNAGRPAEFPCVQLLLALTVGFPTVVPWLFDELEGRNDEDWWSFLDSLEPPSDLRRSWSRLLSAIEGLRDSGCPSDLDRVARWMPCVSEFSYGAGSAS